MRRGFQGTSAGTIGKSIDHSLKPSKDTSRLVKQAPRDLCCWEPHGGESWSLLEERGVCTTFEALGYKEITIPVTFMVPDSALLLFLAMPMLAVGGILFLITNLQV